MTAIWALTAQLIMIGLGYGAALLCGGIFAAFAILNLGDPAPGDAFDQITRGLLLATSLTLDGFKLSLLPSAVAAALLEGFKVRSLVLYLVAGCIVGLLMALPIGAMMSGEAVPEIDARTVQLTVASAAVGAFVYWLIAGRTAGRWMELRWFERNKR